MTWHRSVANQVSPEEPLAKRPASGTVVVAKKKNTLIGGFPTSSWFRTVRPRALEAYYIVEHRPGLARSMHGSLICGTAATSSGRIRTRQPRPFVRERQIRSKLSHRSAVWMCDERRIAMRVDPWTACVHG